MFSSKLIGLGAVKNSVLKRNTGLKTGIDRIVLKTATEVHAEAAPLTPKDTGLLRLNTRIAIRSAWGSRHVPARKAMKTATRAQYIASMKLRGALPVSGINRFLNDFRGRSQASVYSNLPYSNRRDKEGGLTQPKYFLSGRDKKYQRIFRLRLRALVAGISRV